PRDLDQLLLRHGGVAGLGFRVNPRADSREQVGRASAARGPVDAPEQSRLLDAERDVLRDGEFGEERGLLVDGDDAELPGDARRVVRDEAPLDPYLAAFGHDRAG